MFQTSIYFFQESDLGVDLVRIIADIDLEVVTDHVDEDQNLVKDLVVVHAPEIEGSLYKIFELLLSGFSVSAVPYFKLSVTSFLSLLTKFWSRFS